MCPVQVRVGAEPGPGRMALEVRCCEKGPGQRPCPGSRGPAGCVMGEGGKPQPLLIVGSRKLGLLLAVPTMCPHVSQNLLGGQEAGEGTPCRLRSLAVDQTPGAAHPPLLLSQVPQMLAAPRARGGPAEDGGAGAGSAGPQPQPGPKGAADGLARGRGIKVVLPMLRCFWRFTVKWWVFPGWRPAASVPDGRPLRTPFPQMLPRLQPPSLSPFSLSLGIVTTSNVISLRPLLS